MKRVFLNFVLIFMFGAGIWAIQTMSTEQIVLAHEGEEHETTTTVRHPKPEEIGKMETCAVKGTKFEVTSDTPVIDYKDKTFFFCCDDCLDKFQDDPDKFVK